MIAVNTAPARTPRSGLRKAVISETNAGLSASGATASPIMFIPAISTAKPMQMLPASFFLLLRENIISKIPIRAMIGDRLEGFSRLMTGFSLLISERLKIQAVTVVPILEPIITPIVCPISIRPELTRPTSITVTAEED